MPRIRRQFSAPRAEDRPVRTTAPPITTEAGDEEMQEMQALHGAKAASNSRKQDSRPLEEGLVASGDAEESPTISAPAADQRTSIYDEPFLKFVNDDVVNLTGTQVSVLSLLSVLKARGTRYAGSRC